MIVYSFIGDFFWKKNLYGMTPKERLGGNQGQILRISPLFLQKTR